MISSQIDTVKQISHENAQALPGSRSRLLNLIRWETIAVAAITLVAAGLRFYKLGEWSFWGDEFITVSRSVDFFDQPFSRQSLSLLLTGSILNILGVSEWTARLFAAVVGAVTIPILYLPTRKIFGSRTALIASLLLAVSHWHLYWSQNARFYTFLLLLYSLTLFYFYFGIERDRPAYLILSMIIFGVALVERLTAAFLVPVIAAYLGYLIFFEEEKPKGLNVRNIALLAAPGVVGIFLVGGRFFINPLQWLDSFGWVNNNPAWIFSGFVYYVGIPLLIIGALGAFILISKNRRIGILLTLNAALPLMAMLVLSLLQYTANRYLFVTFTTWTILAAVGVNELFSQEGRYQRLVSLAVLGTLVFTSLSEDILYYGSQKGNRDDWKTAFLSVREAKAPDDRVVALNSDLARFYMGEPVEPMVHFDAQAFVESGDRAWFIVDLGVLNKRPDLFSWIQRNAEPVGTYDVHVRARNFLMRVYYYDPADT